MVENEVNSTKYDEMGVFSAEFACMHLKQM